MIGVPLLVPLVGQEAHATDVAGVHDAEDSLGAELANVALVIPVHGDRILLDRKHLLHEAYDAFFPRVSLRM